MTRYEKLTEDYKSDKVPMELYLDYLNYCPGDVKVWTKKYGQDTLVRPRYSKYGQTIGCKINTCEECWKVKFDGDE